MLWFTCDISTSARNIIHLICIVTVMGNNCPVLPVMLEFLLLIMGIHAVQYAIHYSTFKTIIYSLNKDMYYLVLSYCLSKYMYCALLKSLILIRYFNLLSSLSYLYILFIFCCKNTVFTTIFKQVGLNCLQVWINYKCLKKRSHNKVYSSNQRKSVWIIQNTDKNINNEKNTDKDIKD